MIGPLLCEYIVEIKTVYETLHKTQMLSYLTVSDQVSKFLQFCKKVALFPPTFVWRP